MKGFCVLGVRYTMIQLLTLDTWTDTIAIYALEEPGNLAYSLSALGSLRSS